MKKLLWTLSVLALVSCGSDDDNGVTPQPEPRRTLTVVVGENPMQDENAQQNGDATARETFTRTAAATTTASLSHFILNYTDGYYPVFTKTDNTWSTYEWPTQDNATLLFCAYDAYDDYKAYDAKRDDKFHWNDGAPYLSFTMAEDAFTQKDLLVAKNSVTYDDYTGHVPLTFDHACAGVQFYVYKQESASYVVKSIILKNVKNTGNCHFSDYSWTNLGVYTKDGKDHTEYTLTNVDITVDTELQKLPCDWLFIIPQSKDGLKLEIKYTKNGGSETTKTMDLPAGTWEAGKQYTVKIRIGKSAAS
jgi:hypothetical protein